MVPRHEQITKQVHEHLNHEYETLNTITHDFDRCYLASTSFFDKTFSIPKRLKSLPSHVPTKAPTASQTCYPNILKASPQTPLNNNLKTSQKPRKDLTKNIFQSGLVTVENTNVHAREY